MSEAQLTELINWFEEKLPVPARFNRSTSKGAWRQKAKGLSWFKPNAAKHIDQAFALTALLELHDIPIEILRTNRIGYVVYQDAYQIIAEPFADTPS